MSLKNQRDYWLIFKYIIITSVFSLFLFLFFLWRIDNYRVERFRLAILNYTIPNVQFFTSFNKERIDCVTAKAYKPPKDAWLDAKKVLSKSGNKSGALYIPVSKKQIKEVKALKKAKLLKRSIKTLDEPFYYACFT